MKILHIIKSLGRGGAEMLLPQTLKHHDKEKFEFHYIYFLPWKNEMVNDLMTYGGKVYCVPAKNNFQIILSVKRVVSYIREHDINLIHCHLPWAGFLGRLIAFMCKIPLIYTEHNKQERYHPLTFAVNRLTFNYQNVVIAVSDDVKLSIFKKINVSSKVNVYVINNGVDTEYFKRNLEAGKALRKDWGIPQGAIVVGVIAVFRFQKRLCEWLEVAADIYSKNKDIRFVIVGNGPLEGEIKRRAKELNIDNVVIFPGLLVDVIPALSVINIFMMTSLFEGLPIALLEAMSMECQIATTDAGGIKELVVNAQSGLTVPVDNWKILKEKINFLVNKQEFGNSLATNARIRVKEKYDIKIMVKRLERLYLETGSR